MFATTAFISYLIIIILLMTLMLIVNKNETLRGVMHETLKEKSENEYRWSFGRIGLIICLVVAQITLSSLLGRSFLPDTHLDMVLVEKVINYEEWLVGLMLGYVFGGKAVNLASGIWAKTPEKAPEKNDEIK